MLNQQVIVFQPSERPVVDVRQGSTWRRGKLRAWVRGNDGWYALVEHPARTGKAFRDRVAANRVRPVTLTPTGEGQALGGPGL